MKCQNCCKQYFCENFKQDDCEEFVSWIETKNYGEVKRIEDTEGRKDKNTIQQA